MNVYYFLIRLMMQMLDENTHVLYSVINRIYYYTMCEILRAQVVDVEMYYMRKLSL